MTLDTEQEERMTDTLVAEIGKVQETLKAEQERAYEEFQKKLDSKEERGSFAGQEDVRSLESKLEESRMAQEEMKEELRALKAIPFNERTNKPSKPNWGGLFLPESMRKRHAELKHLSESDRELRAIDTTAIASAGFLADDNLDAFISAITDLSPTLSRANTKIMRSNVANMDEIVGATRQIIAATEGGAPAVADSVSFARRTLTGLEIILAEDITLSFIEENIEREGGEQAVMEKVTRLFGNDLNDLGINGRDADAGAFLGIMDGWILQADGDAAVVDEDLAGLTTGLAILQAVNNAMPTGQKTLPGLTFFTNPNIVQSYADTTAARLTAVGDQVLINGWPSIFYFGRPVVADGHFSDATASIDSDEAVIFTTAENLNFGVERSIRIGSQFQERTRVAEYTISMKVDFNHALGTPYVKGYGIDQAAMRG